MEDRDDYGQQAQYDENDEQMAQKMEEEKY